MDVWYSGEYAVSFYEYGGEQNPLGRFIGHTWKDWGLVPTARPFFAPPSRKEEILDAKGINGKADISNRLMGVPLYNNREGSWTFYVTSYNDYSTYIQDASGHNVTDSNGDPIRATILQNFPQKYSQLLAALHGHNVAVVLDEDPEYFYKGFVQVETWVASNDGSLNGITIKYDMFPYKFTREWSEQKLSTTPQYFHWFSVPESCKCPVVAYLYIEGAASPATAVSTGSLLFKNDEIGLDYGGTWPGYNFDCTLNGWTKMNAAPPSNDGSRRGRQAVIVSNIFGNNQLRYAIKDTNGNEFSVVKIRFREGVL